MRRLHVSLAALTVLCLASPLRAQDATEMSELRPGVRIRVEAPGAIAGALTATLLSRTRDSITIGAPNAAPMTVAMSRVTRIDVSRGKSRRAGAVQGLKWGVPIGLATGVLLAAIPSDCTNCEDYSAGAWIAQGLLAGVVWGAGIGALVGRESWAHLELTPHVTSDAGAMRTGLVFRARF
jgi:hypothetical protein